MHAYTHTSTYMCTHTHMHEHTCTHINTHAYTHIQATKEDTQQLTSGFHMLTSEHIQIHTQNTVNSKTTIGPTRTNGKNVRWHLPGTLTSLSAGSSWPSPPAGCFPGPPPASRLPSWGLGEPKQARVYDGGTFTFITVANYQSFLQMH